MMIKQEKISLKIEIYGWTKLYFEEGWSTGPLKEPGIHIGAEENKYHGGAISREDAKKLHDFLHYCFELWGKENMSAQGGRP